MRQRSHFVRQTGEWLEIVRNERLSVAGRASVYPSQTRLGCVFGFSEHYSCAYSSSLC